MSSRRPIAIPLCLAPAYGIGLIELGDLAALQQPLPLVCLYALPERESPPLHLPTRSNETENSSGLPVQWSLRSAMLWNQQRQWSDSQRIAASHSVVQDQVSLDMYGFEGYVVEDSLYLV